MRARGFALFDTAIGRCAVAWSDCGLVGVQLPGPSDEAMRARLSRRHPDAEETEPPAEIRTVIERIRRLLDGERDDLSDVPLDLAEAPEFTRRVYALVRAVPPGSTTTYGEIASRLGDPSLARAIGQAMGQNPLPIVVPCHRVLASGGGLGGFSAPGGSQIKRRMLRIEGAPAVAQGSLFDD